MRRATKLIDNIDYITVGLYFLLVLLGWLNIYSAVYNDEHTSIFDISQRYGKQLMWIGASTIIIILILLVDSSFYPMFSYPIYIFTVVLLIAVLLFGKEVNGARSWFQLGGLRLQPAEFTKFATNLAFAQFLSSYNFKLMKVKNLIIVGFILFFPALLILLQNDTGSALVYFSFVIVLYREGLPGSILLIGFLLAIIFIITLIANVFVVSLMLIVISLITYFFIRKNPNEVLKAIAITFGTSSLFWGISYLFNLEIDSEYFLFAGIGISSIVFIKFSFKNKIKLIPILSAVVVAGILFSFSVNYIFNNVLVSHQQDRINDLLGIEFDPLGAGYNVNQSKIAIGSGGFAGKGFLQGTQTKYDFVPEQSTDFIFCTVGEEWGFLGTSAVLIIFALFLMRLIIIAERQRSTFSRVYGYGVLAIFFFHIAINVGMTIGIAPVIGIPLPFFSYGGSSLWAFTILLFILLKLDSNRMELLK